LRDNYNRGRTGGQKPGFFTKIQASLAFYVG
jgi:hypothetical protein